MINQQSRTNLINEFFTIQFFTKLIWIKRSCHPIEICYFKISSRKSTFGSVYRIFIHCIANNYGPRRIMQWHNSVHPPSPFAIIRAARRIYFNCCIYNMDGGGERTNQMHNCYCNYDIKYVIVGRESAYRRECGADVRSNRGERLRKKVIARAP